MHRLIARLTSVKDSERKDKVLRDHLYSLKITWPYLHLDVCVCVSANIPQLAVYQIAYMGAKQQM